MGTLPPHFLCVLIPFQSSSLSGVEIPQFSLAVLVRGRTGWAPRTQSQKELLIDCLGHDSSELFALDAMSIEQSLCKVLHLTRSLGLSA